LTADVPPRILSLHPKLDAHPLWAARTTPVTALDAGFYTRPAAARLLALAREGAGFDACVFSSGLDKRFLLLATHLTRRLHGALNVQTEAYLAFDTPDAETAETRRRLRHYRVLFSATDLVTVQASFEPELYARHVGGGTVYRWVPWYHYGEARPVSPRHWERRWREGPVLCPGSHRDLDTFAAAVQGLDRRCVVVMRGADVHRNPRLPAAIEARVDLPREEYWALFEQAAAVVLPFQADQALRSLGHIAYFAAAVRKVPVLTSRTPHLADYVREDREVLCCRPEDPRDLRLQLARLLADRALAGRLARAARRRTLREFSMERHVAVLLSAIDEALRGRAGTPAY
jgi:glycosyltransferase involved in cell wall biosynthesis